MRLKIVHWRLHMIATQSSDTQHTELSKNYSRLNNKYHLSTRFSGRNIRHLKSDIIWIFAR